MAVRRAVRLNCKRPPRGARTVDRFGPSVRRLHGHPPALAVGAGLVRPFELGLQRCVSWASRRVDAAAKFVRAI